GQSTCKSQELSKLYKVEFILLRNIYHQFRYITVCVSKYCSVHCALVYKVNGLSCKVFQAVKINRFFSDDHFFSGFLYIQYSLVHDAASVLDELSHGVKICCQIHRRREDTFLVFSFAFSIELFPPLGYIVETWLIVCKYFHCFSFCVKNISNCCILKCIVFLKWKLQCCLSSGCCSFHKLCNVSSACCDRQKSYRCQNRETSSHIIRNYKGLISFFCSKIFQCSSCLVCRSVDTLCCFLFPVFLFQHL